MTWTPKNISTWCTQEHTYLTQCSATGYMFLSLVTQLFGGTSYSISYTGADLYPDERELFEPILPQCSVNKSPDNSEATFIDLNVPSNIEDPNSDWQTYLSGFETDAYSTLFSNYDSKSSIRYYGHDPINMESRLNEQTDEYYDFIIVGAGSAGCVLANRLSEVKNWKILLLEAGPEEPDITMVPSFPPLLRQSSIDWNFKTQPEELTCRAYSGNTCAWARGKTMGGSSAINYLVYTRGNKLDYDEWAKLGNTGWSYDEVLPYFKKSENNRNKEGNDTKYHGTGGPLNVERYPYTSVNSLMLVEAFKEKGLPVKDLTLPDNLGVNLAQSTSKNGRRFSANLAYIRPIRQVRPNLKIIVNAYVTKIIINSNTKIAQGVTVFKDNIFFNFFARKEVIISSGAINSPKLLMLSGIGSEEDLKPLNIPVLSDLKVGLNLQDHVTTEGLTIAFSNETSTLWNSSQLFEFVRNYRMQDCYNSGPLSSAGTQSAVAFIKTKYSTVNAPDIQYHFEARDVKEFNADPVSYISSNTLPLSYASGAELLPILLTPKSRGKVSLNQTNPVFGQPLIYSGFFKVKEDLDVLIEGIRFAISLEETDSFKRYGAIIDKTPIKGCEKHIWGSYDYFACLFIKYTAVIFHPAGTCKMGPSWDQDAVVDSRLRVYGIKNLRVIDGSIMPKIIRGNLNAPIIMIGEKASDMIKEDWIDISIDSRK